MTNGRRQWQPTPVLLPGKSHGRRSLVGCSPWGREESDATEWLHFHFSLSWIGEGNGIPLQCSCLENPRDGRAWWAAIYGVAQSQTRLKWLSSSSRWPMNSTLLFPIFVSYTFWNLNFLLVLCFSLSFVLCFCFFLVCNLSSQNSNILVHVIWKFCAESSCFSLWVENTNHNDNLRCNSFIFYFL